MKWITVKEYAKKEGICLAAAYKRVHAKQVTSDNRFGKLVVINPVREEWFANK